LKYLIPFIILLAGCSLVTFQQPDVYKPVMQDLPQAKEVSFDSKKSMAQGATLLTMNSEEIYYKGAEAGSKLAEDTRALAWRFVAWVGANLGFDPKDPASIEKLFEQMDKAGEEKEKQIHDLKEQVLTLNSTLAQEKEYRKVAETEKDRLSGFTGFLKAILYGILGVIGLLLFIALILQVVFKVPVLTWIVKYLVTGSFKTVIQTRDETISAVQDIRDRLKKEMANGDRPLKASEILKDIDTTFDEKTSVDVQNHIRKLKESKS